MVRNLLATLVAAICVLTLAGMASAQGPSPTPTSSGFGGLFGSSTATPTPIFGGTGAGDDGVRTALAKSNYVVFTSGPWFDTAGNPLASSVHVLMLGASVDPKSNTSVQQIAGGFVALRSAYPTATTFHVLLLSGPNVYDASTTSNTLQLLNSGLVTTDAFIKDVLDGMQTISLVGGTTNSASATPTPTATSTSVPTRIPTKATNTCNPPTGMARLWVKNGYKNTMRFTVGGGEWGTHDFDIPADGQYHFIDAPPSNKYTYSASIPGVGKANAKLQEFFAGQCYYLAFTP